MKPIGTFFYRNAIVLVMVLLVLVLTLPFEPAVAASTVRAAAAATARSDDFNRCTYDNAFWTFENPASVAGASPVLSGAYAGESYLSMTVPAGTSYTFSNSNKNAPRIWHTVSDGDLSYEVKFQAPLNEASLGNWKIMGVLVRDNSDPTLPRYFRFDYDTQNGGLNQYVAYLDANNNLTHIVSPTGPKDLPGINPVSGPLYLRVSYVKATSTWTVTYQVGEADSVTDSFVGTTYDSTFTVTDIGLFVGSTGTTPPGATMLVDYFRDLNDPNFSIASEDAIRLNVQKAGTGSGVVTTQCGTGDQVTLNAVADFGSSFAGWSGDVPVNANPSLPLTMDTTKNVTATFNPGGQDKYFLPYISR